MKQITVAFLIGEALLLWPQTSYAGETRVYIGFSIGTAIVVGSGIASFNIGYSERISERQPASDPPSAFAEIKREGKNEALKPLFDRRIDSQIDSPPPLRFELPFFILRW